MYILKTRHFGSAIEDFLVYNDSRGFLNKLNSTSTATSSKHFVETRNYTRNRKFGRTYTIHGYRGMEHELL